MQYSAVIIRAKNSNIDSWLIIVPALINVLLYRFSGVSGRATMRETSHTCCVTAFGKYSTELEEIHACYERNKV